MLRVFGRSGSGCFWLSPYLHNAAFGVLGLEVESRYFCLLKL